MRSIIASAVSGSVAPIRIVCLPGVYHEPEDFLTAGFDTCARNRGLRIDLQLVDLEMRHLGDRSGRVRLREEVVLPARAQGCKVLWLAGISLGGFIALDYAANHAGELDGVCALAPYLGNRMLTGEIAQASGLDTWVPGELAETDDERRLWRFLQAHPPVSRLLYLGFGRDDRFADAHRLMADALPPEFVDVVPGGHDWRTWTLLWENFLDSTFI